MGVGAVLSSLSESGRTILISGGAGVEGHSRMNSDWHGCFRVLRGKIDSSNTTSVLITVE